MAGETINNVAVRQFVDRLHIEAQQMVAKTLPYADFKVMDGEDMAYDSFGTLRASEATERSPNIVFADTDFSRRKLSKRVLYVPVGLYEEDVNNMLADPQGPIIRAALSALNRWKDRIAVEAALADVATGKDFGTTVTFANDNGSTVDATAGVTYEKVLEAQSNFLKRDVDFNRVGFFISEQEHEALMKETELTSGDFITQKPIADGGMMKQAVGMDLVTFGSNPVSEDPILSVNGSSERSCILIARTAQSAGICMGISKDITVEIEKRPDLLNTRQVVVSMSIGAVRTEGTLVQKFTTTAS